MKTPPAGRPERLPPPPTTDMGLLAILGAACLCILFGANVVAIKVSLQGVGPYTAAGLRFSLGAAALAAWARATGRPFSPGRAGAGKLLVLCVFFTVQLNLFYTGIARTDATRAALIINLQPFFLLFLAHFLVPGDRITLRKLVGILLGFASVFFVFSERRGLSADLRTGDLVILLVAFIWAGHSVYIKRIISGYRAFHLVLYPMMVAAPVCFAAGLAFDRPMIRSLNPPVLAALAYQGLVSAAFGFVLWNRMLKKYGVVVLHSFIFIMPASGVLLGNLLLGEPVTANLWTALALIVAGILVIHVRHRQFPAPFPLGDGDGDRETAE